MYKVGSNYYPICLDFKFSKIYIIWLDGEIETVLVSADKKIIAFKTAVDMLAFAQASSIVLASEATVYDVYLVQKWLTEPKGDIDHELFLNLWNLFIDIATSLDVVFLGDVKNDIRNRVYDKLFDGSGIFIADDPNPVFDEAEIGELGRIMQNGLDILLNNVSVIGE